MEQNLKLYMILLGCKPEGRVIEQHDLFFGIASNPVDLLSQINAFWPEAKGKFHIDVWRQVTKVGNFLIEIIDRSEIRSKDKNLYFLNLGGYKLDDFEEYHYKLLEVATKQSIAISNAKKSAFYKHCGFKGAVSHIDDKYGLDVDDLYNVDDLLNDNIKSKYQIEITEQTAAATDDLWNIGYLTPNSFKNIQL